MRKTRDWRFKPGRPGRQRKHVGELYACRPAKAYSFELIANICFAVSNRLFVRLRVVRVSSTCNICDAQRGMCSGRQRTRVRARIVRGTHVAAYIVGPEGHKAGCCCCMHRPPVRPPALGACVRACLQLDRRLFFFFFSSARPRQRATATRGKKVARVPREHFTAAPAREGGGGHGSPVRAGDRPADGATASIHGELETLETSAENSVGTFAQESVTQPSRIRYT